jgi:hypothetical protein
MDNLVEKPNHDWINNDFAMETDRGEAKDEAHDWQRSNVKIRNKITGVKLISRDLCER